MGPIDETSDEALIAAMRRRLLAEIEAREARGHIVNNVYGGSMGGGGTAGLMGSLGGEASGEDPYDYFVDILRKDLPEKDPETGKPVGWEKKVHRHRKKKVNQPGPWE